MPFLSIQELNTEAPESFINILKGTEDDAINEIIADMIDLMKTNLGSYYDITAIFEAEGAERSRTVLNYLKDLVFYKIQKRRKQGVLDGSDYDEAMKWLEEVSTGKRKADLPPKKVDTNGDGIPDTEVPFMKLGRRKNYTNGW
ncbi:phage protein Gp36 family protein [Chryseobacterium salviniae]|uniref:Phage protein Gp36 family protein n=1 Tax=Chryseobacterium salviniae TaxID=3101750 RepID=A0ABU6HVI3_9FLAO|nr:phage protein Gp36 family protein [Chryseobacterium sp. T9W2-O]MEC3875947.1 phage protein Gp36 family protein [Chryseobacterium sp. T9W2-O]